MASAKWIPARGAFFADESDASACVTGPSFFAGTASFSSSLRFLSSTLLIGTGLRGMSPSDFSGVLALSESFGLRLLLLLTLPLLMLDLDELDS